MHLIPFPCAHCEHLRQYSSFSLPGMIPACYTPFCTFFHHDTFSLLRSANYNLIPSTITNCLSGLSRALFAPSYLVTARGELPRGRAGRGPSPFPHCWHYRSSAPLSPPTPRYGHQLSAAPHITLIYLPNPQPPPTFHNSLFSMVCV